MQEEKLEESEQWKGNCSWNILGSSWFSKIYDTPWTIFPSFFTPWNFTVITWCSTSVNPLTAFLPGKLFSQMTVQLKAILRYHKWKMEWKDYFSLAWFVSQPPGTSQRRICGVAPVLHAATSVCLHSFGLVQSSECGQQTRTGREWWAEAGSSRALAQRDSLAIRLKLSSCYREKGIKK